MAYLPDTGTSSPAAPAASVSIWSRTAAADSSPSNVTICINRHGAANRGNRLTCISSDSAARNG